VSEEMVCGPKKGNDCPTLSYQVCKAIK